MQKYIVRVTESKVTLLLTISGMVLSQNFVYHHHA